MSSPAFLGFIARGTTPGCISRRPQTLEDRFELRAAAIECAHKMEARGYSDIKCFEVRRRHGLFHGDGNEEHIPIKWRSIVVDDVDQKREAT